MHSPADRIVPARFRAATFETFDDRANLTAFEAAVDLAHGRINSLVLAGPTGVGKTHLAAATVTETCERLAAGYNATGLDDAGRMPALPVFPVWLNVADTLVRMRLEMDAPRGEREAQQLVRSLSSYRGLVVLDDLGREKASDWTGETIYALVNARYEAGGLPTLVTTNLTARALAESLYWPAISRLAEDGRLVELAGRDQRLVRTKAAAS